MNLRADDASGGSARPPRASVLAVAAMLVATLAGAVVADRLAARSHDRDEQNRARDATQRVLDAATRALHDTASLAGVVGPHGSKRLFRYYAGLILRGERASTAVQIVAVAPRDLAAVSRELHLRARSLRTIPAGLAPVYEVVLSSWGTPSRRPGEDATSIPALRAALTTPSATSGGTVAASRGGLWVVESSPTLSTPTRTSGYVAVFYPAARLLGDDAGTLRVSVGRSPLGNATRRSGARSEFTAGNASWSVIVPAHPPSLAEHLVPLAVLIVGSAFALLVWTALGRVLRRQTAALSLERRRSERRVLAERVADEERRRIARDLHDSISQGLFSMQLQARTASVALERDGVEHDSPLWRSVHEMGRLTRGALAEIRALIFELRPEGLREEGLVAALDKHAAAVAARHDLNVEVDLPPGPLPLDPLVEEELYRLAQEAIHNAVRHSNAALVKVSAGADPVRGVWLEVSDDGIGFDPTIQRPGHLGLRTMAERAARAGGDLVIDSAPGSGTRVRLSLPLVTA